MKRFRLLLTAFLLLIAALPTAAQVLRLHIDGTIQPIAAEEVSRAVDAAGSRHAAALLIEINTPAACSTPPAKSSLKSRRPRSPSSSS